MMDDQLDQFMEDHINGGYGDILDEQAADEFAEEYDEEYSYDESWDEDIMLAQQELEDFEQVDEYFGFFGYDEF
ncbi:hypothetical protein [Gimesia maris]|uniref:hypothetical protein n=1 Tax=Gimesia maris TaxID=122 RepID=UPI0030D7C4B9